MTTNRRDQLCFPRPRPATPFDPVLLLSRNVSNVICCLVFGQRFGYEDEQFLHLLDTLSDILKFASSPLGQVSGGGS